MRCMMVHEEVHSMFMLRIGTSMPCIIPSSLRATLALLLYPLPFPPSLSSLILTHRSISPSVTLSLTFLLS